MITEQMTEEQVLELAQIGALLKEKRISLGLTQKEVAEKLKLRVAVVQAIESDNANLNQETTFIRGYLRSYAKLVNLDELIILQAFDQYYKNIEQEQKIRSFSNDAVIKQHNKRITLVTWLIVLSIIGSSFVWWYKDARETEQEILDINTMQLELKQKKQVGIITLDEALGDIAKLNDNQNVEQDLSATSVMILEPSSVANNLSSTILSDAKLAYSVNAGLEANTKNNASQASTSSSVTLATLANTAIVQQTSELQAAVIQPLASVSNLSQELLTTNMVSFQFSGNCWLQVVDNTGKTLFIGTKFAGDSLNISDGIEPFRVTLGAPENVSLMQFNGKPVDLTKYHAGRLAKITL